MNVEAILRGKGRSVATIAAGATIGQAVHELRTRGITFEEYDIPGVKTVDGIAEFAPGERGCWFKDSEGNIIALFESARYNA